MKNLGIKITAVATLALFSFTWSARAELKHRWSMTDRTDSVGNADLTLTGLNPAGFSGGKYDSATGHVGYEDERYLDAQGASLTEVAGTINGTSKLSFELWFNQTAGVDWAKLMMLGAGQTDYIGISPQAGGGVLASQYQLASGFYIGLDGADMADGVDYYVSLVIDDVSDTMTMYYGAVNQTLASVSVALTDAHVLAHLKVTAFGLGGNEASEFWPNGAFDGTIDEVRIWDNALTASQVGVNFAAGPDVIPHPKLPVK